MLEVSCWTHQRLRKRASQPHKDAWSKFSVKTGLKRGCVCCPVKEEKKSKVFVWIARETQMTRCEALREGTPTVCRQSGQEGGIKIWDPVPIICIIWLWRTLHRWERGERKGEKQREVERERERAYPSSGETVKVLFRVLFTGKSALSSILRIEKSTRGAPFRDYKSIKFSLLPAFRTWYCGVVQSVKVPSPISGQRM